ncbi:unnamed protein product [Arctogadus glacialis]
MLSDQSPRARKAYWLNPRRVTNYTVCMITLELSPSYSSTRRSNNPQSELQQYLPLTHQRELSTRRSQTRELLTDSQLNFPSC